MQKRRRPARYVVGLGRDSYLTPFACRGPGGGGLWLFAPAFPSVGGYGEGNLKCDDAYATLTKLHATLILVDLLKAPRLSGL